MRWNIPKAFYIGLSLLCCDHRVIILTRGSMRRKRTGRKWCNSSRPQCATSQRDVTRDCALIDVNNSFLNQKKTCYFWAAWGKEEMPIVFGDSTTFVSTHVCVHTRLCPHAFVSTHVCAQTRLWPDTFVPRHVCA